MPWKQALTIGCFQCFALWPGMSRSASTIIGGMLAGASRRAAAEYSFLAAVPVMLVATVYDVYKSGNLLTAGDIPLFALGSLVAFVSAAFAVRWFVGLLGQHTLVPFAIYRLVVGIGLALIFIV